MAKSGGRKFPSDYDGGFYFETSPGWIIAGVAVVAVVLVVVSRIGAGG